MESQAARSVAELSPAGFRHYDLATLKAQEAEQLGPRFGERRPDMSAYDQQITMFVLASLMLGIPLGLVRNIVFSRFWGLGWDRALLNLWGPRRGL